MATGRATAIGIEIETGTGVGIAKVRGAAGSIVALGLIARARSTVEIVGIVDPARIAAPRPTAEIADALTAAVVRVVIATGRERTERPLPPKRWLG